MRGITAAARLAIALLASAGVAAAQTGTPQGGPAAGDTTGAADAFAPRDAIGTIVIDAGAVRHAPVGSTPVAAGDRGRAIGPSRTATVPEPSTYALMGAGLGALALAVRFRRLG